MNAKQLKRVTGGALKDLAAARDCKNHEWVGPIREDDMGNDIAWYLVDCLHCPMGKAFPSMEEAADAIG